jgi:hypothetical protein
MNNDAKLTSIKFAMQGELKVSLQSFLWGFCNVTQYLFRQQREDTCCWRCRSCGKYQVKIDEYHCEDCAMGSLPSHDHSRCVPIPEEFIDYQNPWAIAAMAVASLGQSRVICPVSSESV